MRKAFFPGCCSRAYVKAQCTWAARIVKAENGYWAFESPSEYHAWATQR